jgi:ribonucleoside-diphosphate reductase alpha chain
MHRKKRKQLKTLRFGYNFEFIIGNCPVILTTNEYEDGSLAEIFIRLKKEGSDLQTLIEAFAISISLNLQYGVPLEDLIEKFTGCQFNPKGKIEGHEVIKEADSIIDMVFQELKFIYLDKKLKVKKIA